MSLPENNGKDHSQCPQRLFLALWPEDAERQKMAKLAEQATDRRRVPDRNLHMTLVFLGNTDATRLAAYEAALTNLSMPALDLQLDQYGYWAKPRILWLGCDHTPPALYALVAELQRRLRNCGFIPERRAFQAHITLARKFSGAIPPPPTTPLRWQPRTVALVESLTSPEGVRYQVLRCWGD